MANKATKKKVVKTTQPPTRKAIVAVAPKNVRAQQFGQLLSAALLNAGLSQSQLARAVGGCPRDSISGYCKGENIPGNERLKKIADVLGIKPDDLLPNFGRPASSGDLRLSITEQGNGRSWIQCNRDASSVLAAKFQAMLAEEDADLAKKKG